MEKALAAYLLLLAASQASVTRPTEVVQVAVGQMAQVAQDASLAQPPTAEPRRQEIRGIAEQLFDVPEMTRRALARHWMDRTAQQREKFARLLTAMLERTYFGKLENSSGGQIVYTGERVDGEFATVRSKILAHGTGEVPIEYRLHRIGSRWTVYDVLIEGVSFVNTCRVQFNKILQTSSDGELVERLKAKQQEFLEEDTRSEARLDPIELVIPRYPGPR